METEVQNLRKPCSLILGHGQVWLPLPLGIDLNGASACFRSDAPEGSRARAHCHGLNRRGVRGLRCSMHPEAQAAQEGRLNQAS